MKTLGSSPSLLSVYLSIGLGAAILLLLVGGEVSK